MTIKHKTVSEEFLTNATQPLIDLVESANNQVLSIMAKRIKECGKLSSTDIHRINQMVRTSDLKAISDTLTEMTNKSPQVIEKCLYEVASEQEKVSSEYYKYRKIEQIPFTDNKQMKLIINAAIKNATDDFLNISKTTAFNMGGKTLSIQKAYNQVIDKAVYEVQQGYTDYYTAMRKTVSQLAESGLQTVDFASGYSRRLDSQVRMNVLDGAREMNNSMREQQGKEFGADMVFISLHELCAIDHIHINGQSYTTKQWESVSAGLTRQVGELNCRHSLSYGIQGISENPYSKSDIKQADDSSQEMVTFTGLGGKELTMSRYDCSQYQRQLETTIRKQKDARNMCDMAGDITGKSIYNKKARAYTAEYKRISDEMGLSAKTKRLVVNK